MDNHEVDQRLPSVAVDINTNSSDWQDAEDIELGSEEHDLFLRENYIKPNGNGVLPFLATSQQNGFNGRVSTTWNRSQSQSSNNLPESNDPYSKVESFQIEDVDDSGSPVPSSVVYQLPNYQQFAGKLAPSSPTSIIVSFIIIVVILCVTIVPMIIPLSNSDDPTDDVILANGTEIQKKIEHADARCKCICPPTPQTSHKNDDKKSIDTPKRRLYVGNTSPNQCNCNNIVQPHLNDIQISLKDFCARCECRYQSRNTTTIRRIIIFFIAVLIGLGLYMFVQYLLKYFRITRRHLPRQFRWLIHRLTESG